MGYPSLPGKKVVSENTSYFIHGIVHGSPYISIPLNFKKQINNEFKDHYVICEDGFKDWIENSASFNEISYFGLNKRSFLKCFKNILSFGYSRIKQKKSQKKQIKEMNSLEDLINIRDELFKKYSSEPEGMNYLMYKSNKGSLENPRGELPFIIKRYVYEAKKSIEYSKKNNIRNLHIVVGCAHELPLEYLLKNRNILKNLKC